MLYVKKIIYFTKLTFKAADNNFIECKSLEITWLLFNCDVRNV